MRHKEGKLGSLPERGQRNVPIAILLLVFCSLSFYLGKIFCNQNSRFEAVEVTDVSREGSALKMKFISFPECSIEYQDYTPCTDPRVTLEFQCCISERFCDLLIICARFSLNNTEVEEVWYSSAYFYGAPLPSTI